MSNMLRTLSLAVALWLLGNRAGATSFEPFVLGLDADQIFTERRTAEGFGSFTICTPIEASDPSACGVPEPAIGTEPVRVGYVRGEAPLTDFLILPVDADVPRLWQDGHRAPPGGAVLRLENLPPGPYELVLLAHGPASGDQDETFFWVDGVFRGSVPNIPNAQLLIGGNQSLVVGVETMDGSLEIMFEGDASMGRNGWLNGLVLTLIPEPASGLLAASGLGLLVLLRLRRR
jgi:hypothetical protein